MDGLSPRLLRDVLAALDAAADGGDVALAEAPRTPYRPPDPRIPAGSPARGFVVACMTMSLIYSLSIAALAVWMGWRFPRVW